MYLAAGSCCAYHKVCLDKPEHHTVTVGQHKTIIRQHTLQPPPTSRQSPAQRARTPRHTIQSHMLFTTAITPMQRERILKDPNLFSQFQEIQGEFLLDHLSFDVIFILGMIHQQTVYSPLGLPELTPLITIKDIVLSTDSLIIAIGKGQHNRGPNFDFDKPLFTDEQIRHLVAYVAAALSVFDRYMGTNLLDLCSLMFSLLA